MFYPGFIGLFMNPFYFARKGLVNNIKEFGDRVRGKTLDVGCGNKHYKELFSSSEYIGLEIDSDENRNHKSADFFYDGHTFPFEDKSFESLVTNQVFEHVFNPDKFLKESFRVLKTKGTLLMTVPFVWDEHEQPYDYARYSSFGIKALLEEHGFEVVECRKTMADVRVIFQLINAYLYKKLMTKNSYTNLFLTIFFMAPFNILGEIFNLVLPKNEDLYLDNIVIAIKKT